ncbi:MAG TPA: hypothetical protein VM841_07030 [Actinomycetota bacterium]|nr:hypothetical protein [Actinomycetota bacterium]
MSALVRSLRRAPAIAIVVGLMMSITATGPASASRFGKAGPPQFPSFPYEERLGSGGPPPFIQDADDPHKWVWTIDPSKYAATGTITFWDYSNAITREGFMSGPGGASVNDFQVTSPVTGTKGFDFERPSFTQDVDSVEADFLTPDPPHDIHTDFDPTAYHPDEFPMPTPFATWTGANIDGVANLYKFAYSVAPGTQFMNMQVDKAGNYYVARRDMQWEWIDELVFKNSDGDIQREDTQFNIQPYPISDAYGWCGALVMRDPSSLSSMAGQLIKDIAFDVFAADTSPASAIAPVAREVVPSFVMRSFGIYEVDVTMLSTGVRQQFTGIAKGVHIRPVAVTIGSVTYPAGSRVEPGDPDFSHWLNRVSPFAAGVVPIGAWVINEGTPYMQVVPAGTPGAVWHQNKFAGAAFLVRGDMERRVNYINTASGLAADQATVTGYNEVYHSLIQLGLTNSKTGQSWKRADWADWEVGGTVPVANGY